MSSPNKSTINNKKQIAIPSAPLEANPLLAVRAVDILPLIGYWVCIRENGFPDYSSISYTKKESIKSCIKGTFWTWIKFKRKGWNCIKVNVQFYKTIKKSL